MKDFGELVVTAAETSGDVNAANYAGSLLRIAEKKLSRQLLAQQQKKRQEVRCYLDGKADLPSDFVAMISVHSNGALLVEVPFDSQQIDGFKTYALAGGQIITERNNAKLDLAFFAEIPSLEDHGENWLLADAPDVYLLALLHQIYVKNLDIERAQITKNALDELVAELANRTKSSLILPPAPGGPRP